MSRMLLDKSTHAAHRHTLHSIAQTVSASIFISETLKLKSLPADLETDSCATQLRLAKCAHEGYKRAKMRKFKAIQSSGIT